MNENPNPMTLHVRVIVPRFVFTARETEDGTLILAANLPGVRDSLKVTIQGRGLTVSTDEFSRDFAVGHEYDLDKIETKYEDGVLTVTVPPAPARVITFRERAAGGQIWRRMGQSGSRDVTKAPDQIEAEAKAAFDAKIKAQTEYLIKNGILTKDKIENMIKDGLLSPDMLSLAPVTKAPDQIEAGIVNPVPATA